MKKRLAKGMVLVLAAVLLLTVPGLVGCGGGGAVELPQIKIGILTDFTGPASFAVRPTLNAFMDCLKLAVADGTIEGATVKFYTYDQRTDYSRTPPGYVWLKGQGVVMMNIISPTDRQMLRDKFAADQMPVFGSGPVEGEASVDPWTFLGNASNGEEMEILMQWVMDNWDYAGKGRPPKIGHKTWNISSGTYHQAGIDRMLAWYPDKFSFAGVEKSPTSQSSWAAEVAKFKDCDYIIITTSGPQTTTFIKEARDRNYAGVLLGCQDSFPGYWDLVEGAVLADKIGTCYDMVFSPWWNTDCELVRGAKRGVMTYHAGEADAMLRASGGVSGWMYGLLTVDAINRAIGAVGGAENLTGAAIRDAFLATNLSIDGYPRPLKFTDTDHVAVHEALVYKFNAALPNKWEAVSDWIKARSAQ